MSEWRGSDHKASNVLTGVEGDPIISSGGDDTVYLGRVIIEVWENRQNPQMSGPHSLAYMAQVAKSAKVSNLELLDRVAKDFPVRHAKNRSSSQQ